MSVTNGDTRPWEDTVISALREAQWMRRRNRRQQQVGSYPGTYVKLDGDAEELCGDFILEADDRFYLFEAKANSSCFRTEWSRKKDGKSAPKLAFLTLKALAKRWRANPGDPWDTYLCWSSIACHQFLCWSNEIFDRKDGLGRVVAYPYLSTCASLAPDMPSEIFSKFEMAELCEKLCAVSKCIPASALLDGRAFVVQTAIANQQKIVRENAQAGLLFDDFKRYIDFLVVTGSSGGDDQMPLNAVVCSEGGYVRHVTSLDQLIAVVTPKQGHAASASVVTRHTIDSATFSQSATRLLVPPSGAPKPVVVPPRPRKP